MGELIHMRATYPTPNLTSQDLIIEAKGAMGIVKINALRWDDALCRSIVSDDAPAVPSAVNDWIATRDFMVVRTSPLHVVIVGDELKVVAARDRVNALETERPALAVDLTDGRAPFVVSGKNAPAALSSLIPLSFHPVDFPANRAAISLFGEVGVFIICLNQGVEFLLFVDQVSRDYAWRLLTQEFHSYKE